MWTTTGLQLKRDRRGVSNIIVVVLSLVIIIAITSNVILWSYQMNQLDWERMREDMKIRNVTHVNATRSFWSVVHSEYAANIGSLIGGTYEDTQVANDGTWETFQEEAKAPRYILDANGTFIIDVSAYPVRSISTVEIQLRYRASDAGELWYLKAFNWTANGFNDSGFNYTAGHKPTKGWDEYAVNLTDQWRSYVQDEGRMLVKFCDEGNDAVKTRVDIDFLGVRVVTSGTQFTFRNEGASTAHLVSLWINNSTSHQHYDINIIVNSAETLNYTRADISLPSGQYIVRIVTDRGNSAVYLGS